MPHMLPEPDIAVLDTRIRKKLVGSPHEVAKGLISYDAMLYSISKRAIKVL